MKPEELSKFATQQHLRGMTDENIAGSVGMTPECMYRKMNRLAEKDLTETKEAPADGEK